MGVKIRKGGQWVSVDGAGGGITDVKQYSDNAATRTERTCSNPIAVLGDGKIIGIGTTSNAYGERYIQTTEPSSSFGNMVLGSISRPCGPYIFPVS